MQRNLRSIITRTVRIGILIAVYLGHTVHASAQGCDLLLRDGVFNTFNRTSGRYAYDKWHQAWCNGTVKETKSANSTSVSLDVVVEAIPIGLGFSDAQQFQTYYKQQFCGNADRTMVNLAQDSAFTKTADPGLLSSYVQCRQVENAGLVTHFGLSPDQKVFTIVMKYSKPFETGKGPRVKSISFVPVAGVKCKGTIVPPMRLDADSNALQCERTTDRQVSILVNTDVGAFTRNLEAVPPPPSDQQRVMAALPSGTILGWAAKSPIPSGWRVCNGEGGTPNLLDRFPYGATDAAEVGKPVGAAEHSHSGTGTASQDITKHGWSAGKNFESNGPSTFNHTHPVTISTNSQPNIPPGTKIIFIMKM